MGQGTESCGGYEIHFDPVEHELEQTKPNGMSVRRIENKIRWAERNKAHSVCTHDEERWGEMIDSLEDELFYRRRAKRESPPAIKSQKKPSPPAIKSPKKLARGAKLKMRCHCGVEYEARKADVNRGWGLSCSKSCASIRRKYKKPKATII